MNERLSTEEVQRVESRRYRIIGVIGTGGFGKVYRARLEGAEGFFKDVAIKLMKDDVVPEEVLQRFRDEARILGLVRDRAIVTVDPPTRLDGRWAVVMEYVDGVSGARLLRRTPFPPRPALELVQEVARALEKVYRQPGPDGTPLRLLHRDIKPGNLQITPSGEIKILDFGIARAMFEHRESQTTNHIGGTIGYIAPERLHGQEGPEGDIYSLGVVLHVLVTGEKPSATGFKTRRHLVERTPGVLKALALAAEMMAQDPAKRPAARVLEDRCAALVSELSGDTLRRWAEQVVPEALQMAEDDLVGNVLTETIAGIPLKPTLPDTTEDATSSNANSSALPAIAALVLGGVLLFAGIGIVVAGAGWVWAQKSEEIATAQAETARLQIEAESAASARAAAERHATEVERKRAQEKAAADKLAKAKAAEDRAAEDKAAEDKAAEDKTNRPRPRSKRTTTSPKPTPTPSTPSGPMLPVTFSSAPLGATVIVDGATLGKTPLVNAKLTTGTHQVQLVRGSNRISKQIRVGRRAPKRYVWKGGDSWEVHY